MKSPLPFLSHHHSPTGTIIVGAMKIVEDGCCSFKIMFDEDLYVVFDEDLYVLFMYFCFALSVS